MYPSGELAELALRKKILQARIAVRRLECVVAAVELSRPLAMIDRALQTWHRVAPLVKMLALPGGLIFATFLKRRGGTKKPGKRGKLAAIMSALPLIMRGVKMFLQIRAAHAAQTTKSSRTTVHPGVSVMQLKVKS
jgi:hypothetical protein